MLDLATEPVRATQASKSHEYPVAEMESVPVGQHRRTMILCKVARGKAPGPTKLVTLLEFWLLSQAKGGLVAMSFFDRSARSTRLRRPNSTAINTECPQWVQTTIITFQLYSLSP